MQGEDDLIDLTYLKGQMFGKSDQIKAVLNLFIEHTPPAIAEIRQILESKQWDLLRNKVHAIKIYFAYVGNKALLQKLEEWERALKSNPDTANHQNLMMELENKTTLIIEKLRLILKQGTI